MSSSSGRPSRSSVNVSNRTIDSNQTYEIQHYRGDSEKISVDAWLRVLEKFATRHRLDEQGKKDLLDKFLGDSALEWYAYIPENESWDSIKEKMVKRFGLKTILPAVQFMKVKYDPSLGVRAYYEEKRKLGIQGGLSEDHMVQFMIDGLPYNLKSCFNPTEIKTLDEFYEKATIYESREKDNKNTNNYKPKVFKRKFNDDNSDRVKFKRNKPPLPCKICEEQGFKNRFHWMRDCRNKKPSQAKEKKNLN